MVVDTNGGRPPTVPSRLLVGVSGSVAALMLPVYLNAFRMAGVAEIRVVATHTAGRFLAPDVLRLLSEEVVTEDEPGPGHIALTRWPDRVLVLPATAHLIGCLANGLAPSLLTTLLLAYEGSIVLAPAMNPQMWHSAPVRRNVATLRNDGHVVVDPVPGNAYEVASRRVLPSLIVPEPPALLRRLTSTRPAAQPVTGTRP